MVMNGHEILNKQLKRKNKHYVPMIVFTSKTGAYDELGTFENRGIKGFVKELTENEIKIVKKDTKRTVKYIVYLPKELD